MEEQWLTANQAAEWLGCSVHTIYRWIHETHGGTASVPLLLKPRPSNMGGRGKSWLIESQSLLVADGSGVRRLPYVKEVSDGSRTALTTGRHGEEDTPSKVRADRKRVEEDTPAKVQADRKRWVEGWVTEGKPLDKVLAVFPPSLHAEIEACYRQAVEKRKSVSGEIWGNEEI